MKVLAKNIIILVLVLLLQITANMSKVSNDNTIVDKAINKTMNQIKIKENLNGDGSYKQYR